MPVGTYVKKNLMFNNNNSQYIKNDEKFIPICYNFNNSIIERYDFSV